MENNALDLSGHFRACGRNSCICGTKEKQRILGSPPFFISIAVLVRRLVIIDTAALDLVSTISLALGLSFLCFFVRTRKVRRADTAFFSVPTVHCTTFGGGMCLIGTK